MKNICWTTLLLLCFQQVVAQKKMYIGLKASPCISWLKAKSNDLESEGAKIGFGYMLMTDFSFSENYSFGTGVRISHHGGEISYTDVSSGQQYGTSSVDYNFQYIEVPITIKMRTKEIGYFTYYGQFGLGASYLIGAKADYSYNNAFVHLSEKKVNVYDDLQPFRASMIIGLGTEYNISGSTLLIFGFTFNNGFTNPFKGRVYEVDGQGNVSRGDKIKAPSNYVSLDLGIVF